MTSGLQRLLGHRLLIVSGKGGTGKTTVSAALCLAAARSGIRTLAVELGREAVLPELLCARPPAEAFRDRRDPLQLADEIFHLRLVPEIALIQYLETELRLPGLVARLTRNPGFRRLLDAAPGWRALIALGRVWRFTTRLDAGRPRWPLVIVDAPATGHGLSLLRAPDAIRDVVPGGPLRRHTDAVWQLLRDPERTRVVPVASAEELAVREAIELHGRLAALGIGTTAVIANGLEPPLQLDPAAVQACLAAARRRTPAAAWAAPSRLRDTLANAVHTRDLQRAFLAELERATSHTPLCLPYLVQSIEGPAACGELASALMSERQGADAQP